MIEYRNPKDSEKQVKFFAIRVLRRMHSLGAKSATLDDIEQELWIAWCKACKGFDETGGASFKTYFDTGMKRHINRYVEKTAERFYEQTVAISLDAKLGDDADMSLGDIVSDNAASALDKIDAESCYAMAIKKLSPRAKMFVLFLKEQPRELLNEVFLAEEKSLHAKSMGLNFTTPHSLTTGMIFDFMGVQRTERADILKEVRRVGAYVSR